MWIKEIKVYIGKEFEASLGDGMKYPAPKAGKGKALNKLGPRVQSCMSY